jgi:hypothetical protein
MYLNGRRIKTELFATKAELAKGLDMPPGEAQALYIAQSSSGRFVVEFNAGVHASKDREVIMLPSKRYFPCPKVVGAAGMALAGGRTPLARYKAFMKALDAWWKECMSHAR